MKPVNIHAAKTHLSRLVDRAAKGEEIVIAKAGKPMAKLVPFESKRGGIRLGVLKGKIRFGRNFDAPLPDDIARALGIID